MKRRIPFPAAMLAVLLSLVLAGLATVARADDVQVSAALSDNDTEPGESVDYTITVNGASEAQVSQNIDVDGLTITYEGPNSQTQISFGMGFGSGSHIVRSVIHTYSVVPQRGGDFVIPAQQVAVDGKTYKTDTVTLHVEGGGNTAQSGNGGGGSSQSQQSNAGGENGGLYYAEFLLPKSTAYIGEAVPFEVRLFVDARVRANLEEMPEITADGCTVEKTGQANQSQVERNGRPYDMVSYKCAVTPVKAGNLSLGPVTVLAEAVIPQHRPRRMPGFDDPFFQNFNDAFQMMGPPQQITIRGEPVPLTALPLPTEGMPRSFAGAVGNYTMKSSVNPTAVQAGDPITISVSITGQGNFDKVTAPQFVNTDGWRTYPPSAKFQSADEVGIAGTKTFDIAAIPQTKKTSSPALEWSYFDPDQRKYVTLTENGTPITVQGDLQSSAAPVIAQQSQPANGGPKAGPAGSQAKPDIEYIRADSTGWGASFQPLYENRMFWAAQGGPLLALLAFAGIETARKRAADQEARRLAGLRREKEIAMAAMNRRDLPEAELYQAAARVMRLEAAIQTGRDPETLDGAEVASARALDAALAERVRQVFDRQAEALYAGAGGGRGAASAETRVQAIETVKEFENAARA